MPSTASTQAQNKNVIPFGPKDFGVGHAIQPLHFTTAKFPGEAIEKRSGRCKVLGAENANMMVCNYSVLAPLLSIPRVPSDVRAALGQKHINLLKLLLAC